MKRTIPILLALCLLLGGCSKVWDGKYISVEPHQQDNNQNVMENATVGNYSELLRLLRTMVEAGVENRTISVAPYEQSQVDSDMQRAIDYMMQRNPFAAYAVSEITYDLGTSAGQPAVAVSINYIHDRSELRKIQRPKNWQQAQLAIATALKKCEPSLVLHLSIFEGTDFAQWIANYATANPNEVMEQPVVTVNLYPDSGTERIVELKFTYQNTKDALLSMQTTVQRLFSAASVYANSDDMYDRYFKLYSFLTGLSPKFQIETSITPAYSLMQHGVGDSRAVATVYAALCAQMNLECFVVTGTRAGEPWHWNIIYVDGLHYHVDLLACNAADEFATKHDEDMTGYVWDYSSYPACVKPLPDPEPETVPTQPTEPTQPAPTEE